MEKKDMLECLINAYSDGNKRRFSALIGVSPQTVSAWLSRNTFDNELLFQKCKGLSAKWLLTNGEGEMLEPPCPSSVNHAEAHGNGNAVAGGDLTIGPGAPSPSVLMERVKNLEALLAEKERLIRVLMKGQDL